MEAFRKRAATLLSSVSSRRDSLAADRNSSQSPHREKAAFAEKDGGQLEKNVSEKTQIQPESPADSGEEGQSGFSHAPVRVLPPWVTSADDEENEDDPNPSSQLEPMEPSAAHLAQHNHMPAALQPAGFILRHRNEPGRRYDAQRGSEVPTSRHHPREIASRWRQFAEESGYVTRNEEEHHQLVDEEYLIAQGPDFSQGWKSEKHDGLTNMYHSRQRTAWERAQRTILRSAFIPLIFRLIVFFFCIIALSLGGNIYNGIRNLGPNLDAVCGSNYETSRTSSLMAIIIDSAAIVYIFYITWDEYKGLPLGLRSGKAKVLVLLFDLFFIVFSSANVTLAFESVVRFTISCQDYLDDKSFKPKQDALASTLLIALIAWLMTFAVSVLRVVEKVER